MFHQFKIIIAMFMLILASMAFSQNFDLKIQVDRNGNPDPGGKPFEQYFHSSDYSESTISIGGRKHIFKSQLNCKGIHKNYIDAINWEIEKTLRCAVFKLAQIKTSARTTSGMQSISTFLEYYPENSKCVAAIFYLWTKTAGVNFSSFYNFHKILSKLGNDGKKYAKNLQPNANGLTLISQEIPPFEVLAAGDFRLDNDYVREDYRWRPDTQIKIIQILEQESPPKIVKKLLADNIINSNNFPLLLLLLETYPEWQPEVTEFLKKQYVSGNLFDKDRIVAASINNREMSNWLKPHMPAFIEGISRQSIRPRTAAAYVLISGESDLIRIAYKTSSALDFFYEYAHATGKYNDACNMIEKLEICGAPDGKIYAMLRDKSNLTMENRLKLLKIFFGVIDSSYANRNYFRETLLHPDNLPALLLLTNDSKYAPFAWLVISTFPVTKMPPNVAAQYFARCKQNLKSSNTKIRNETIWSLRFFTPDVQRPEAVKLLFAMLLSSNPAVAAAANESLIAMGPACMPELLEIIGGSEQYFAMRACELIGNMGLYGQEATPELMKLLNSSSDWMLKTMIIKALALIKGTEAVPEIEKYVSANQPILATTAKQALVS